MTWRTWSLAKCTGINLTQSVVLKLKGSATSSVQSSGPATPPATYYGEVLKSNTFLPKGGNVCDGLGKWVACGTGVTQAIDGKVVYSIHVLADDHPALAAAGQGVLSILK